MPKVTSFAQQKAALSKSKGYTADLILQLMTALEEGTVTVIIPVTGWGTDENTSYPYYYDIPVAGITAKDRADITIAPDSIETAITCELCPSNETLTDKIRIRATSIPAKSIAAEYWVTDGKE